MFIAYKFVERWWVIIYYEWQDQESNEFMCLL